MMTRRFGLPGRNGLSLGLGSIIALSSNATPGLPGTYYDWTGASLPSPWDTLRRAGLGTRVDSAGLVGFGPHNLIQQSENVSAGIWSKAQSATTPDAETIVFAALSESRVEQSGAALQMTQIGDSATVQVEMRADVPMQVNLSAGGDRVYTTVNVTTQWQRFTATRTRAGAGTENVFAIIANVGAAAGTVKVRRIGINLGPTAFDYVPTTTAPVYLPRPTHNPSTLAALGVLFEGQATNLLGATEDFSNAYWARLNTTVSANSTAAPDGAATADALVADAGTGILTRIGNVSLTTVSATAYTLSIFAKAGTHQFVQCFVNNQGGEWVNFTLSGAGVASANGASTADIVSLPNGWYRLIWTYTAGSTDRRPFVALSPSGSATRAQTWSPAGGESVFIWGAQLETGTVATSYIPNPTTGTALRTGDFAGGGITGAALTALFSPTQPFTLVLPFRKSYSLASVETLLGLCAGASAGTTNQLGIATQGNAVQLIHSGGSGPLVAGPTVGAQLMPDSDLTNPAGWNVASGVVVGSGVATFTNVTSTAALFRSATVSTTPGVLYEVIFTIISATAGSAGIRMGSTGDAPIRYSQPGTYRYLYAVGTAAPTNQNVIADTVGFSGVIDNISVREVTPLTLDGSTVNRVAVSVDPTFVGAEQATDGVFSSPANWTTVSTWVVSGGALVAATAATGSTFQPGGIQSNKTYIVTYQVTAHTSGTVRINLGSATNGVTRNAVGTYSEYITVATAFDNTIRIFASSFVGAVDNISVREAGAMSISVNGSAPVETTGIAYTGAGTTHLIPGARDSSGGQAAVGFTSPGIRVAAGQYITGSALQALST